MSELGIRTSQGPPEGSRSTTTTFLDLIGGQMDGLDRPMRRKRSLKERLRFKGIGCCGPTWGLRTTNNTTLSARDDDDDDEDEPGQTRVVTGSDSSGSGMNLETALATERHYRARETEEGQTPMTPLRVSLMRLLEETAERVNGRETETEILTASMGTSNDSVCCVCMGREKGAAFIPCGHTFCRVCSRELWLNRGTCPLCNRPIIEILDIY
ncbi:PREDICTED: death-associated inhibitor of apoptosis 1-like [Tarenaya hassleriana]|uniref:death-associated inhibitor of apoptosis 1-like n=1 Tax=Tarenaya hassleriana TaxID=28532 RepID=UPI00053C4461|nr:PREDICTED: death-associated inhibitor of apoptosis 1-like [Tarenaya hassleriana]